MADFLDRALSWGMDSLLREGDYYNDGDDDDMPDVSDLLSDDSVLWDNCQSTLSPSDYDADRAVLFPEFFDLIAVTASEDLSDEDSSSMDHHTTTSYYPPADSPFALPFEKRFEATKRSLEECMRKSQETRRSLTLSSCCPDDEGMQEFLKQRQSVQGVVASVQASTRKLQKWVVPSSSSTSCSRPTKKKTNQLVAR